MLGIAALKIQTAGYSGQQTRAEMRIEGMEHFEELRELIMEFVRADILSALKGEGSCSSIRQAEGVSPPC